MHCKTWLGAVLLLHLWVEFKSYLVAGQCIAMAPGAVTALYRSAGL